MCEKENTVLSVENLTVCFGQTHVVQNVSFTVSAGKTLAIVGESGSGKSISSLSILRLVETLGGRYHSGKITYAQGNEKRDLLTLSQAEMRHIRGSDIAMIFQEPMTSLNPVLSIGDQISEVLMLHLGMGKTEAYQEAQKLLEMVRLPEAKSLLYRYPHQLSGGMRQRVMIAMALACRPKLLIADEPTTALDVTIQAQILSIIRELQQELGMAILFITHDMGVVAEIADDVIVMWKGQKIEEGAVKDIFADPQHVYTRSLLASVPRLYSMKGQTHPTTMARTRIQDEKLHIIPAEMQQNTARYDLAPTVSINNLVTRFPIKKTFFGRTTHQVHAVENVSFDIYPGETVALVGESGSGKSTIGKTIQQLVSAQSGEICFEGRDIFNISRQERKTLKQKIHYIFQDPFASLDPRKTIGFSIAEPIRTHNLATGADIQKRVDQLLERVELPSSAATRFPHEFSGGQRQRICIARALASDPKLIIADEVLSALDVSIQAEIINLFMELQQERGLSYLFISHDMAVVEKVSHRVAVLYLGQIMEFGTRQHVFETPQHDYTRKLLSAVPIADPTLMRQRNVLQGDIPSPIHQVGSQPVFKKYKQITQGHLVATD